MESLMTEFVQVYSAIGNFVFLEGRLGINLIWHFILSFS